MTEEERYLKSRLQELSDRSYSRGIWQYSDFLTLAEQNLIPSAAICSMDGGYEAAERRLAVFGSEKLCSYEASPPISYVHFQPVNEKFAEKLTHRDYLGSLMACGIKRSCLGDIVMDGSSAYVICLENIAQYLCDNISSVRRTPVTGKICSALPDGLLKEPESKNIPAASLRTDVLISAVWHLSRSDAKELFSREMVFCNGRTVSSPDFQPEEGSIISVRGKGRFRINEIAGRTKKGRLSVSVSIW